MGNNYAKMTPEQLRKLYDYNNKYSRDNYKNLVVKLDKRRDVELIEFLDHLPNKSGIIRDYLTGLMKASKGTK